jgi:hypothetical protein
MTITSSRTHSPAPDVRAALRRRSALRDKLAIAGILAATVAGAYAVYLLVAME